MSRTFLLRSSLASDWAPSCCRAPSSCDTSSRWWAACTASRPPPSTPASLAPRAWAVLSRRRSHRGRSLQSLSHRKPTVSIHFQVWEKVQSKNPVARWHWSYLWSLILSILFDLHNWVWSKNRCVYLWFNPVMHSFNRLVLYLYGQS